MILIKHRINNIKELKLVDQKYGVEIDIRSQKNRLFLNHDPFKNGVDFDSFLKKFKHNFLVVNVKEEGIEFKILNKLKKNKIKNFFLLDVTIPQLVKILKTKNERRIAFRISKYEGIGGALKLAKRISWIWLDTFDGKLPISFNQIKKLKQKKFKICLVSPELPMKRISHLQKLKNKIYKKINFFDAVCTKKPNIWES
jgi:hypothetical protein